MPARKPPRHPLNMCLYETLGSYLLRPGLQVLYRVEVAGAERAPLAGACIVASNHESTIDPFVMGFVTGRVVHWMAKSELWENKLAAMIVDGFGPFESSGVGAVGAPMRKPDSYSMRAASLASSPKGPACRSGAGLTIERLRSLRWPLVRRSHRSVLSERSAS